MYVASLSLLIRLWALTSIQIDQSTTYHGIFVKDALDLFVGNYVVSPTEGVTHESPVIKEKMDTRSVSSHTTHTASLCFCRRHHAFTSDFAIDI